MNPQIIEIALEPAELSYALNLLQATSLYGAERATLFPTDPTIKREILSEGMAALKEHAWLMEADSSATMPSISHEQPHNIDPTLMLMVAAAADPQLVVSTTRYVTNSRGGSGASNAGLDNDPSLDPFAKRGRQSVTHYVAGDANLDSDRFVWQSQDPIIVEQVRRADGRYHLVSLPMVELISQRIAQGWESAESTQGDLDECESFTLPAELGELRAIERSQLDSAVEQLEKLLQAWGLAPGLRTKFIELLTSGELVGEIQVSRVVGQHTLAASAITLIRCAGVLWMVSDLDNGTRFQPIKQKALEEQLQALICKLNEIPYEPQTNQAIPSAEPARRLQPN